MTHLLFFSKLSYSKNTIVDVVKNHDCIYVSSNSNYQWLTSCFSPNYQFSKKLMWLLPFNLKFLSPFWFFFIPNFIFKSVHFSNFFSIYSPLSNCRGGEEYIGLSEVNLKLVIFMGGSSVKLYVLSQIFKMKKNKRMKR